VTTPVVGWDETCDEASEQRRVGVIKIGSVRKPGHQTKSKTYKKTRSAWTWRKSGLEGGGGMGGWAGRSGKGEGRGGEGRAPRQPRRRTRHIEAGEERERGWYLEKVRAHARM